jgi:hypothetical protein
VIQGTGRASRPAPDSRAIESSEVGPWAHLFFCIVHTQTAFPEYSFVFKTIVAGLLALSLLMALPGCSKHGATAPESAQGAAQESTASQPPAAAAGAGKIHPLPSDEPGARAKVTGIAKAEGGKTIAEVYAEKDQLAGKTVTVRGKVVKANANIMGKNWLHIDDGSGTEKTNDLTVTTAGTTPAVGDTVVVTGTVALDKDFGMGYRYIVIIEDADVQIE